MMKKNSPLERLYNGVIKENPTVVLMLGMCPTLAVTTSATNGLGMGLSTTVVLALSNLLISMLRKVIPDRVRMPAFIVVVASLVTIVQFLVQGFVPALYAALGIYIPLIVVNCIILGRAESYASKNPVLPSFFDGLGMGLGFTMSLTIIGLIREILGAGQVFGKQLIPLADASTGKIGYTPISIFVLAPGAFFVLALVVAVMNVVRQKMEAKGKPLAAPQGCLTDSCAGCALAATCGGMTQQTMDWKAAEEQKQKAAAEAKAKKAEEAKKKAAEEAAKKAAEAKSLQAKEEAEE